MLYSHHLFSLYKELMFKFLTTIDCFFVTQVRELNKHASLFQSNLQSASEEEVCGGKNGRHSAVIAHGLGAY